MQTRFDKKNSDFTNKAHLVARETIYPYLFKGKTLDFIDTQFDSINKFYHFLDSEWGIDRIVKVSADNYAIPLEITIQERFRKSENRKYQDITITEWNYSSGKPSELYKIKSQIFLYGYFNEDLNIFEEALFVNTSTLLLKILSGQIKVNTGMNPKNQSFITIKFKELFNENCVLCHYLPGKISTIEKPLTMQEKNIKDIKENLDFLVELAKKQVLVNMVFDDEIIQLSGWKKEEVA